jgi:hypothetical protein
MKEKIIIVIIVVAGIQIYEKFSTPSVTNADLKLNESSIETIRNTSESFDSIYSCDGRQHCSEMTSCEEATFFIQNCPNTKMDGDHDGIPCESQHCGY